MKVFLQWAKAVPETWEQYDVRSNAEVRRFARKAEPNAQSTLDQNPGWLVAANIQGVTVSGWDHVGLTIGTGDLVTLSCWNDDPDDWPVGHRWGMVWTFLPLAPDFTLPPPLTGVFNTRQTSTLYAESAEFGPNYQPWSTFPYPDARNVFHGIWVDQATWDTHTALQTPHEWMEWGT